MSGSMTFPCAACGAVLWIDDFDKGRAVLIGDLPYCAACPKIPKPPSTRRGRVPIFAMPSTPSALPRRRSRGWIWVLLALALAAAFAWLKLRPWIPLPLGE